MQFVITIERKVRTMVREPNNPFHPGEMLIEEFLEPMGMSQMAFAKKTAGPERDSMRLFEAILPKLWERRPGFG